MDVCRFAPTLGDNESCVEVYCGPMPIGPRDYYDLASPAWNVAYVYCLLDAAGDLLYVGRARQPGNRFDKHRRKKEWWPEVQHLTLFEVEGRDHEHSVYLVSRVELDAIRSLSPRHNIAGVGAP